MDTIDFKSIEQENDLDMVDIKVLDAQKYKFNRNFSSRIQFHPFTYFYYVITGSGKLSVENKTVNVKKNDLIIINSNVGHTMYVDDTSDTCEVIGFGVEALSISKINNKGEECENLDFYQINLESNRNNITLIEQILEEFTNDEIFSKSMADAKAAIFIIDMLRTYQDKISVRHDRKINRQIDYIKTYIDNNYADDIKLEELSTMAYMNKFHLISEFKQSYRVTPIEYLILKRIEIAKNLLISTNHSMEEISSIVGFNSQSYFNQVFKKKVGQTPSQFRKKHRL